MQFGAQLSLKPPEAQWELDEDATNAYIHMIGVDPARRRSGIGSRLLTAIEDAARAAGRPTMVLSGDHLIDDGDGPRLSAPQGDASMRADSPAARFALAHGYELGQLYRVSALDVLGRGGEFRERLAAAQAATSDGYRLVGWRDHAPDELVDSLARAHTAVGQRDYRQALSLALDAKERARDAARTSAERMAQLRSEAERAIDASARAIAIAEQRLTSADGVRLPAPQRETLSAGLAAAEKALQEARTAFDTQAYPQAKASADAALTRVRDTPRQAGLDRAPRLANVRDAFVARDRSLAGRRVVLVDDVRTTGATLRACRMALAAVGVREIAMLVLAVRDDELHDATREAL